MNERIDAFLTYVAGERGLSGNTVSAYRNDLQQFAAYLEEAGARRGGIPLATVDRELVAGYLLTLRERGYAPATVARKVAALKSFFQYLRRAGEIPGNPTEGIGTPEVQKSLPRSISADDVGALLAQAERRESPDGFRDAAMLRLLYATGMRVGEMVGLDLADVRQKEHAVRVVGRGGRERIVPVDPSALQALEAYLEHGRPYLVRHTPGEIALFLNHRGQRLTRQGFWLIMKALAREAGLDGAVTPHTLRHSFATHQVDEGLALEQLRKLLGHASLATTLVYAQVVSQQRAARHGQDDDRPGPVIHGPRTLAGVR